MQTADTVLTVPRALPVVHPYAQLAAHYRALIKAQAEGFAPGDAFPSIAKIAEEWGLSRPTAQRAVAILKSEGLVRTEHGVGTYVVGKPAAEP